MRKVAPAVVIAEISAMATLMLSCIWIVRGSFPGAHLICLALYIAIGVSSHRRRGETAREIGFRLDNLSGASLQALIFVGPLIVATILIGLALGTIRESESALWIPHILVRISWATLQQYGLLAFFSRRFGEIVPGRWPPVFAASALFALFHLPNPFLTAASFGAAVLSIWLYRRIPNIWALGIAHGLLSTAISRCLPPTLTVGLRVGPSYQPYLEMLESGSMIF